MKLAYTIDRTHLGGLGNTDNFWFGIVDVRPLQCNLFELFERKLAARPPGQEDLGAIGKEFGRTALIGLDMRKPLANDTMV